MTCARVVDPVPILRDLVEIDTHATVEPAIEYLARRLEGLGVQYRVTVHEGHPLNILASIGEAGPHLIINSHLDTVPAGDLSLWTRGPFTATRVQNRVYGRGAADAKGSVAAMVAAFETLAVAQRCRGMKLTLMLVGGEEHGGLGSSLEVGRGLRADAAVVGEPSGLLPCISHKGVLRLRIGVRGKAAHASSPELGVNAVYLGARVANRLEKMATGLTNQIGNHSVLGSLAVTMMEGGSALNMIPDSCAVYLDRRLSGNERESEVLKSIEQAVMEGLGGDNGDRIQLEVLRSSPPTQVDESTPIARGTRAVVEEVLRRDVRFGVFRASCDMATLVTDGRIPSVILGPGDLALAHTHDEWVSVDEVREAAQVYERIPERWLALVQEGRA